MLSLLTMLVLKDVLFVNFNNNLLGKISLIALTVYSFFHNKFVGVALTFLYVILSLNIVEAMENKKKTDVGNKGDNKKKNKNKANVPKNDMGNWRKTNCKKGKLLLNGTPIKKDPKDFSAFLNKHFKNQLTFDNKKEDLCNPCDVKCNDYTVSTKYQVKELTNLEKN
mgnify:CR=1 FL=1